MADIQIGVPAQLGLTDEQVRTLSDKVQAQFVEVLKGTQAEAIIAAKPQTIEKSETVKIKAKVEV